MEVKEENPQNNFNSVINLSLRSRHILNFLQQNQQTKKKKK